MPLLDPPKIIWQLCLYHRLLDHKENSGLSFLIFPNKPFLCPNVAKFTFAFNALSVWPKNKNKIKKERKRWLLFPYFSFLFFWYQTRYFSIFRETGNSIYSLQSICFSSDKGKLFMSKLLLTAALQMPSNPLNFIIRCYSACFLLITKMFLLKIQC